MENNDPIDKFIQYPQKIGVQAIRIFIISLIMNALAFAMMLSEEIIGITSTFFFALAPLLFVISFALSIGGLSVGLAERKYTKNLVTVGIIGNILLILLPVVLMIYNIVDFVTT